MKVMSVRHNIQIALDEGEVKKTLNVLIMKVQTYSLDDIFEKGLLLLIPFYIFHMRKGFQSIIVMNRNYKN